MMPVSKLKKQVLQPSTLCVGILHRELSLNSSFHGLLVPDNWNTIKFFLSSRTFHCGHQSMKSSDDVNHLLSNIFIFEDHTQINLESIKIQILKRVTNVQEGWDFETYQKNRVAKAIISCIQLLNSNLEYKELNKNIGLMPLHRGGNGRRRMKRSMRYM